MPKKSRQARKIFRAAKILQAALEHQLADDRIDGESDEEQS